MKTYLLGGMMAAAMVLIAPALAQTAPPTPAVPQIQDHLGEPGWQGRERSSVQTRATVARHVQTMFAKLDGNHDGVIVKAEAEAAKGSRSQWAGKRKMRHDGPGGQRADHGAMFERMDANRDGSVSRAEYDAAHAQREQRTATRDANGDGRPDARGARGARQMGGMGGLHGDLFGMADGNRDGRVTLQEATDAALRQFDMADVNRDGQLTRDERMQMHQRMRADRRPG